MAVLGFESKSDLHGISDNDVDASHDSHQQ